jgi:hypothetical protein
VYGNLELGIGYWGEYPDISKFFPGIEIDARKYAWIRPDMKFTSDWCFVKLLNTYTLSCDGKAVTVNCELS